MKKRIFIATAVALMLGMTACQKEVITPSNPSVPGNPDVALVFHIEFDSTYAHITFSENMDITNVTEIAGEYTIEQIEQMDLAYTYNSTTHTGTLTAVGVDENNVPINYQIAFTYSETDDTITINLLFANAEDEDTTISFPLVFHRDI